MCMHSSRWVFCYKPRNTWLYYCHTEDLPDDAHAECEVFMDIDIGETRFQGLI